MKIIQASILPFSLIRKSVGVTQEAFPLFIESGGAFQLYCPSPIHGRSAVVKYSDNQYTVIKGCGLTYTSFSIIQSSGFDNHIWGLLAEEDAIRDYSIGLEVSSIGIRTNKMEYVLKLNRKINVRGANVEYIYPFLLQYKVNCPYRLADFPFVDKTIIKSFVNNWRNYCKCEHKEFHMQATDIIVSNLSILHSNGVLHNAMNIQNYTWDLELLDFEAARTNHYKYPVDYELNVPTFMQEEIIQSYQIISYIAWALGEEINFHKVESVYSKYGFNLKIMSLGLL